MSQQKNNKEWSWDKKTIRYSAKFNLANLWHNVSQISQDILWRIRTAKNWIWALQSKEIMGNSLIFLLCCCQFHPHIIIVIISIDMEWNWDVDLLLSCSFAGGTASWCLLRHPFFSLACDDDNKAFLRILL